jgi:hypothetical protein
MVKALFKAVTAFFNAWPLFVLAKLHREIDEIADEIFSLGVDGSPSAKLRIEQLAERRSRIVKQVRALRPADSDVG